MVLLVSAENAKLTAKAKNCQFLWISLWKKKQHSNTQQVTHNALIPFKSLEKYAAYGSLAFKTLSITKFFLSAFGVVQ